MKDSDKPVHYELKSKEIGGYVMKKRVTDYVKYNGVTYITYTFPTYRHSFRVNANSNDYIIV